MDLHTDVVDLLETAFSTILENEVTLLVHLLTNGRFVLLATPKVIVIALIRTSLSLHEALDKMSRPEVFNLFFASNDMEGTTI